MGQWAATLPAVGLALAVLLVPGLGAAYAAGLRGIPAWGLAPPISVSVVAVAAVVAAAVGVRWSLAPAAVTALAVAAAAGAWGRARRLPAPDSGSLVLLPAAATAGAAALAAGAVVLGVGRPDRFPQTFDAVFHLNAVARAVETGNASSLALGTLTSPERSSAFYPGAWHAITALVASAGVDVAAAANAVSLAIAAVWPLGCLFLVRQALGRSLPALLVAPVVSVGLGAAPFLLLSYGTLWPNALATLLLPAALATGAALTGLASDDALGRGHAWAASLAVLPGLALAHPNAVVTTAVYAVVLATGAQLARAAGRPARGGRRRLVRVAAGWAGCAALAAVVLWGIAVSPFFASTRGTDWPARQTVAQAAGEALLLAPQRLPVSGALALLGLVGLVAALRRPRLWWLVGCHAVAAALFVLAAGSDSELAQSLTGPWYNDAFRFAALLPVTGVPLAVLGFTVLGEGVGSAWSRAGAPARPWAWSRRLPAMTAWGVGVAFLVVVTQGVNLRENAGVVGTWYRSQALVSGPERELLDRLDAVVPAGSRIVGNPWNGSALAEAVGGRQVLFPHLNGAWGRDRVTVASSLADLSDDAAVCPAVRRLGADFVLSGPSTFWPGDRRQLQYAGLQVQGRRGFEPVASGGRLTLYRITGCRTVAASPGP
jgi:hypothetical protein